jgi:hypothetical protein
MHPSVVLKALCVSSIFIVSARRLPIYFWAMLGGVLLILARLKWVFSNFGGVFLFVVALKTPVH